MSKAISHPTKKFAAVRRFHVAMGDEGGSLVEMALSCLILIPVLFGIVQLSIGLYCFHFAADAAREATRWAIVRGSTCNTIFGTAYCSPTDTDGSGATGNDIAQYVKGLGYPYSGAVTVTTKWCVASAGSSKSWSSCSLSRNNDPGNQVQVTVSYAYPLVIPFVPKNTLNVSSVSSMTIVQ
jgi:Flp pilus assembly protein TadG